SCISVAALLASRNRPAACCLPVLSRRRHCDRLSASRETAAGMTDAASLPIRSALPALRRALGGATQVVLQAPPGAGKTTAVPLALLDAEWLAGRRVVMLEPRRLAARAAARHMARQRGEPVGETVGYRTRLDSRTGP